MNGSRLKRRKRTRRDGNLHRHLIPPSEPRSDTKSHSKSDSVPSSSQSVAPAPRSRRSFSSDQFPLFLWVPMIAVLVIVIGYRWIWTSYFQDTEWEHTSIGGNSEHNIAFKVSLDEAAADHGALCLDGSTPIFYYSKGIEQDRTKFVLLIEGGAWCYDEDDCWSRRQTRRGSTVNDSDTKDLNEIAFLQNSPSANPLMHRWNHIYVRMCDGMSFAGDVQEPLVRTQNASRSMYFRGNRIWKGLFAKLSADYGLDTATDVVVAGSSSGGFAVFLHSHSLRRLFDPVRTKLVLLSSGGFMLRSNGHKGSTRWADRMKYAFSMQNGRSSLLGTRCLGEHQMDDSECVFPQNLIGDIVVPTFFLNSQFDEWQSVHILGTATSDALLLNQHGQEMAGMLRQKVMSDGGAFGAFIDGCYHHSCWRSARWNHLYIDGTNAATAFSQFYSGLDVERGQGRRWWYENVTFPCDECKCPVLK